MQVTFLIKTKVYRLCIASTAVKKDLMLHINDGSFILLKNFATTARNYNFPINYIAHRGTLTELLIFSLN